jgi:homoserine kinase
VRRHRTVRVPASSANLGPGYDVLAAAIALHLQLDVEETGQFAVLTDIQGVPTDRSNLCVRAFELLHPADGLTFSIRSEIPLTAGLGSSAAAIVAGLSAADHMYELDAPLLERGLELEGHPDNLAASLLGGFVVSAEDGAVRFDPPAELEGLIVIPPDQLSTAEARQVIPDEIPIEDAVHNTARVALLMLGLARSDLDLVARGLADRIHQPRRESLYPRSMELVRSAGEVGAIGATISGAGPAVMFWCHFEQTGGILGQLQERAPDCDVRRVQFSPAGADVRAL